MPTIPDDEAIIRLPHERRALLHRARYHGQETPTPPWDVQACFKPGDRHSLRVRVLCGYVRPNGEPCSQRLGEASRPDPEGNVVDEAGYGRLQLELETYGQRQGSGHREEWTLTAPPEFPGFERREDGSFAVIRPRTERALDGARVRGERGRRKPPNLLWSGYMPLSGDRAGQKGIAGWWAPLPAVVACPLCARRNLIAEPALYERSSME